MLIILSTRSLTFSGAMEGFKWYLTVDFSAINGEAILTALGQSFFSIGIASGGAFIYGSYLRKDSNIPQDSFIIVGLDTLAALLIVLAIFPAIFSIELELDSGASLLFFSISNLLSNISVSRLFG